MSNITLNFFFQKHLPNQLQCCPGPFYSHPSLLSCPHAPPPQCSVLYACALCSCILNKSEINVFDADPQTALASLSLLLLLSFWLLVHLGLERAKTGVERYQLEYFHSTYNTFIQIFADPSVIQLLG
uniref:Uncharacterized protein n=1 Tax=Sus scrofa TaxID=9823 RepID=A0A4X1TF95_PIG